MDKLKEKIEKANLELIMNKKGYAYFTNGSYNLNIIGVRRAGNKITNQFDDFIVVEYKNCNGELRRFIYSATTDPGLSNIKKPLSRKGCAILVPNQYRGCWTIGYHKGKYEALVQTKPVKVYRDGNKDDIYDFNPKTIDNGLFGINIHKAGSNSTIVDGWSAGCQVLARSKDFDELMRLAHRQVASGYGKTFTYTLITEEDLNEII